MKETKEINALFTLLDDPDKEVFSTVSDKIVSFGQQILPNLENLWETTPDDEMQKRIELLIRRLHFRNLHEELDLWNRDEQKALLEGSLLVSRLLDPELKADSVRRAIDKMRLNIWLEINNYLTPLETTNVISTVLHNFHHLKGTETLYSEPNNMLVNKLLETKKGSAVSLGILYLSICEMLSIPIRVINIPNQFILAYFNEETPEIAGELPEDGIRFFIDPLGGQIYTYEDVEAYFRRSSLELSSSCLQPMSNTEIIQYQLKELAKCFTGPYAAEKQEEILLLSEVLSR